MSRQPSEARGAAPELATVYLSMADLVRPPSGAQQEPVDPLKTCIGLGPDDPIVVPRRERSEPKEVTSLVPVSLQANQRTPAPRWFERHVGRIASVLERVRLESRVLRVCWRLRAAGRHSLRTLARARHAWALAAAGLLVIGVLGMARMGEGAVADPEAVAVPAPAEAAVEDVGAVEVVRTEETEAVAAVARGGKAWVAASGLPARTTLARAAADATAGAQYALALDLYRQLALEAPGNAAYANMIVALERRVSASTAAR